MRNKINYLDEILKEKLSDIRVTPNISWNDFSWRNSFNSGVGKSSTFLSILKNTRIKLYTGLLFSGVIITVLFLFSEDSQHHYGKRYEIPMMGPSVKISNPINKEEFNKKIEVDSDDHVRIKIDVPIHKKVIIKKEIILRDSTHD
jgi:hypothetical protein